jgi:hypothetical protein
LPRNVFSSVCCETVAGLKRRVCGSHKTGPKSIRGGGGVACLKWIGTARTSTHFRKRRHAWQQNRVRRHAKKQDSGTRNHPSAGSAGLKRRVCGSHKTGPKSISGRAVACSKWIGTAITSGVRSSSQAGHPLPCSSKIQKMTFRGDSLRSRRPRCGLSNCTLSLSGASRRSSCERLVCIRSAIST